MYIHVIVNLAHNPLHFTILAACHRVGQLFVAELFGSLIIAHEEARGLIGFGNRIVLL